MTQRKGPRSRQETEQERLRLDEQTALEIDRLVAEFHGLLPRERAVAIGAIPPGAGGRHWADRQRWSPSASPSGNGRRWLGP